MSQLDYNAITSADLELVREPRRSTFTVVHKPSGTVGKTPVIPGSHEPARFRRPNKVPKENRSADMIGFVEGRGDASGMWPLIGGDNPRNEFLVALCEDKEALRKTFEGVPEEAGSSGDTERQPVPDTADAAQEPQAEATESTDTPSAPPAEEQPAEEAAAPAEPVPADPAPEPEASAPVEEPPAEASTDEPEPQQEDGGTVGADDGNQIDELLAGLDG